MSLIFILLQAHGDSCGGLPSQVQKALEKAKEYRESCKLTQKNEHFAINDYSQTGKTPKIYLFNASGECQMSTEITYGVGKGYQTPPQPCSEENSHLTPPGFHITKKHNSPKFGTNCLLLSGLESQGSAERGILIHESADPETSSSWGCTGIKPSELQKVLDTLKEDALVYNYFGDTAKASGCASDAGMKPGDGGSCKDDSHSGVKSRQIMRARHKGSQ